MTDIHTTLADGERMAAEVQQPGTKRVSLADIVDRVVDVAYLRPAFKDTMLICAVQLDNGFVLVGKSAPVDPANFDEVFGRQLAYDDAIRQAWPLLAFLLLEDTKRAAQA